MTEIYNKAHQRTLQEQEGAYQSPEVPVNVYAANKDLYEADKVIVPFDLEFEYRTWGVKDVSVFCKGVVDVPYMKTDEAGGTTEGVFTLDLEQLDTEWASGGRYTADSIDIWLDAEGEIDYDKSSITFQFIDLT